MKEKVKKVLVWIFEFVLFCGYFYVLFVNLVCGFGYGGISSRGQAIKILCASFFLAVLSGKGCGISKTTRMLA